MKAADDAFPVHQRPTLESTITNPTLVPVGLILGGWLVLALTRRLGVVPARRLVATAGALCMTGVPMVSWLRSLDLITAVICVATFGLGCFMVNYLAFAS